MCCRHMFEYNAKIHNSKNITSFWGLKKDKSHTF